MDETINIPERARDLAAQLREHASRSERAGLHDIARRARERANEVEELGAMAILAEKRLGNYMGPSSATIPPPPMPATIAEQIKTQKPKRRTPAQVADRALRGYRGRAREVRT